VVHTGILGILVGHTEKPLSRPLQSHRYSKIVFQGIRRTIFNQCDLINDLYAYIIGIRPELLLSYSPHGLTKGYLPNLLETALLCQIFVFLS
jgi:hypothetical protein